MDSPPHPTRLSRRVRTGILGAILATLGTVNCAHATVNISSGPTKNMSCSAGLCSPTAKNAVLNVTDLANLLQASDVKVTTGSGAITIEITAGLSWASANRLTLDANCNVSVKAPVTVAGPGGLSIVTNDGGTGCDLLFFPGGKVDFWDQHSSLLINNQRYKLESSLPHLAKDIAGNPGGLYALASDYDAAVDGTYTQDPVSTIFTGSFEGLGNAISNLTIAPKDRKRRYTRTVGLFLAIGQGSAIRHVSVLNGQIISHAPEISAGLLVSSNQGTVAFSYASGSLHVVGSGNVGGLVGESTGIILQSRADVTVDQGQYAIGGGLVGRNDGMIDSSYASGETDGGLVGVNSGLIENSHASSPAECGGLACYNYSDGIIRNCFATGAVYGEAGGGLVGSNSGMIVSSYATGNVTATYMAEAGGLVGYLGGGTIKDSYATGAVSGGTADEANGGLIGENASFNGNSTIETSYSIGSVSGQGYYNGGVVGSDQDYEGGDFHSVYWDLDTSGIDDPGQGAGWPQNDSGITGLTDALLKSALPAGFDPAIWGQSPNINSGYPYLLANPPP
jgi:hypothetical protein